MNRFAAIECFDMMASGRDWMHHFRNPIILSFLKFHHSTRLKSHSSRLELLWVDSSRLHINAQWIWASLNHFELTRPYLRVGSLLIRATSSQLIAVPSWLSSMHPWCDAIWSWPSDPFELERIKGSSSSSWKAKCKVCLQSAHCTLVAHAWGPRPLL